MTRDLSSVIDPLRESANGVGFPLAGADPGGGDEGVPYAEVTRSGHNVKTNGSLWTPHTDAKKEALVRKAFERGRFTETSSRCSDPVVSKLYVNPDFSGQSPGLALMLSDRFCRYGRSEAAQVEVVATGVALPAGQVGGVLHLAEKLRSLASEIRAGNLARNCLVLVPGSNLDPENPDSVEIDRALSDLSALNVTVQPVTHINDTNHLLRDDPQEFSDRDVVVLAGKEPEDGPEAIARDGGHEPPGRVVETTAPPRRETGPHRSEAAAGKAMPRASSGRRWRLVGATSFVLSALLVGGAVWLVLDRRAEDAAFADAVGPLVALVATLPAPTLDGCAEFGEAWSRLPANYIDRLQATNDGVGGRLLACDRLAEHSDVRWNAAIGAAGVGAPWTVAAATAIIDSHAALTEDDLAHYADVDPTTFETVVNASNRAEDLLAGAEANALRLDELASANPIDAGSCQQADTFVAGLTALDREVAGTLLDNIEAQLARCGALLPASALRVASLNAALDAVQQSETPISVENLGRAYRALLPFDRTSADLDADAVTAAHQAALRTMGSNQRLTALEALSSAWLSDADAVPLTELSQRLVALTDFDRARWADGSRPDLDELNERVALAERAPVSVPAGYLDDAAVYVTGGDTMPALLARARNRLLLSGYRLAQSRDVADAVLEIDIRTDPATGQPRALVASILERGSESTPAPLVAASYAPVDRAGETDGAPAAAALISALEESLDGLFDPTKS